MLCSYTSVSGSVRCFKTVAEKWQNVLVPILAAEAGPLLYTEASTVNNSS